MLFVYVFRLKVGSVAVFFSGTTIESFRGKFLLKRY